jgi:SAM-dependent methyltransferase
MKDNFSTQAEDYSKFRPKYPPEMIEYIVSFAKNKEAALDVATGNGQVAAALAKYFTKVYATDLSREQLEHAVKADNIVYKEAKAEETDFEDNQFDMIVVAQGIHWFDFDAFYKEVYRTLKPDGIFVAMGYGLFFTNEHSHKILSHFYHDIIGPYWDPERRYLDENYTTIPFPFDEINVIRFNNSLTWTFEQLTGYLETWSAVQHYIKKNGTNPVDIIREKLKESWEQNNNEVTFPMLLRIGTLKNQ